MATYGQHRAHVGILSCICGHSKVLGSVVHEGQVALPVENGLDCLQCFASGIQRVAILRGKHLLPA